MTKDETFFNLRVFRFVNVNLFHSRKLHSMETLQTYTGEKCVDLVDENPLSRYLKNRRVIYTHQTFFICSRTHNFRQMYFPMYLDLFRNIEGAEKIHVFTRVWICGCVVLNPSGLKK